MGLFFNTYALSLLVIANVDSAKCGVDCKMHKATGHHHTDAGLGEQVAEFFGGLFSSDTWPARWHCGTWSDFHGWFYIVSDLLIWASYFAIPLLLAKLLKKRTDIPFPKVIWLFVAFIILCGTTHLIDAGIFWWPVYRFSALIRFFTAVVSIFTVFVLYKVLPLALTLRTVDELEHEISERKHVEEKLAGSEFLLKEAGRLSRMGGWEFDVKAGRNTWSETVYEIYELQEDFDIDSADLYSFFTEESGQRLKIAIEQAFSKGESWDLELQMITAKGSRIWVRHCGECFYDENGEIYKLRGICMDIDKYKLNEMELSKSHELLFQSHQQLKTFTHILSHNIRNHSSNISLLSGLIEPETLDENNADLFDKIVKVSRGLNTTLDDLAEAIKIRENTLPPETINFRETAERVVEIIESAIINTGTIIKYDFNEETVWFPRLYLESILINLISNSIKYRRVGETPYIHLLTYTNETGKTVLQCKDNGLGIDLDLHGAKLFGLYKTFHIHDEAHGVGLFLMKTQIESQGGSISVESSPGKGATFTVTFK